MVVWSVAEGRRREAGWRRGVAMGEDLDKESHWKVANTITMESIEAYKEALLQQAIISEWLESSDTEDSEVDDANNNSTISLQDANSEVEGLGYAQGDAPVVSALAAAITDSPAMHSPRVTAAMDSFLDFTSNDCHSPKSPAFDKTEVHEVDVESPVLLELCSLLERFTIDCSPKLPSIPRFYHRMGSPVTEEVNERAHMHAKKFFGLFSGNMVAYRSMGVLCEVLGFPYYWKRLVYDCCRLASNSSVCGDTVLFSDFENLWTRLTGTAHDEAARFIFLLSNGRRDFAIASDFEPFLRDLVTSTPFLAHLSDHLDSQIGYIEMVKCRLMWSYSRSWSDCLTVEEVRHSDLLQVIRDLEKMDEGCFSRSCFSYAEYCVTYTEFLALSGGQSCMSERELLKYNDGALTELAASRVFTCARNLSNSATEEFTFGFRQFANFMMADVAKNHAKSVEYWFRVMDLDGDGRISHEEMRAFYMHIASRIRSGGPQPNDRSVVMRFDDVVALLVDAIGIGSRGYFTLADLRRSSVRAVFFEMFLNSQKCFELQCREESVVNEEKLKEESGMFAWNAFCLRKYDELSEPVDVVEVLSSVQEDNTSSTENDAKMYS